MNQNVGSFIIRHLLDFVGIYTFQSMELTSEVSAEQLPLSQGGSLLSLVQSDPGLSDLVGGSDQFKSEKLQSLSEQELTEKLENILLERIQEGNKDALFQLGQLYFEEVTHFSCFLCPKTCS